MPIVDVLVPQMGEGLQEVLIVELTKKPGDRVRRDEPLYQMETDKATMEVESPHEGVLVEWLAGEGDTLAIGAPVARMEIEVSAPVPAAGGNGSGRGVGASPMAALSEGAAADARRLNIPPRTRAYAKEKGLTDDDLARVPAAGARLMPADIDAYLESGGAGDVASPAVVESHARPIVEESADKDFSERPLSPQDKTFIYRLKRSASTVIQATAKRQMDWDAIRAYADRRKSEDDALHPSAFQCIAWCIAQAAKEHPRFRSALVREDSVREYAHLNMGIAVAMPTGELTIAVVRRADTLTFEEFVREAQARIREARDGTDQADESTQLLLTYMGPYEVTDGVPVLVAPACAVLFIGSAFELGGKQVVNLSLSFDHRLIHGVEAAEFLRSIVRNATHIGELAGA
jgi:Pyruvate/2-oxoglutarate dehydrogenase complex, dihydrolipoamide acyltransferase (E2) component, and related enzymes